MMSQWLQKPIKALLLDITGVLYEGGSDKAIRGSVEAINRLRESGLPFRFVTNETQCSRNGLVSKLQKFGFSLKKEDIFAPAPAVRKMLELQGLRPLLLVHPDVISEFEGIDLTSPNCVVMGDAAANFTYDNMNAAFQLLISSENPLLITMGKGKFYREKEHLVLDVGSFTTALEYACDIKAVIMGKPSKEFYQMALNDMQVEPSDALMIGDDIVSDVGGAQACGMRGVLVRTGKYRPSDENHKSVKPDGIIDCLADGVNQILGTKN